MEGNLFLSFFREEDITGGENGKSYKHKIGNRLFGLEVMTEVTPL